MIKCNTGLALQNEADQYPKGSITRFKALDKADEHTKTCTQCHDDYMKTIHSYLDCGRLT